MCLVAGPLIKFSNDDDLTNEDCHMFLTKHMEQDIFVNKLLQRLFVRLEVYILCRGNWKAVARVSIGSVSRKRKGMMVTKAVYQCTSIKASIIFQESY